jgi:molybdate transport system ATP-binding protein
MLQCEVQKKLFGSCGEIELEVNFTLKHGEFVALVGESGSGKTTLLRILAGLERAEGVISFGEEVWQRGNFILEPQKRHIGFVFQDYALFEHMTVEENLLYVTDNKLLAKQLLEMTHLLGLAKQSVRQLSGGQKQRVSLCRAMMRRPKLLLMDEPLSAVDYEMREALIGEIKQLHETFGTTTLMVTHEMQDVYRLATRLIELKEGSIDRDVSVQTLLQAETEPYKVVVIALGEVKGQRVATVALKGVLFKVEVDTTIEVGQSIEITL